MKFGSWLATLALLASLPCTHSTAAGLPLETVADIPLPGHASRLDYASIDTVRRRLFIAHLGDSNVIVFGLDARKPLDIVPDIGHVHGVLAVAALGRVYASATSSNEIVDIDASSLAVRARSAGGFYPDGMAWVPAHNELYVSDEHGRSETVIDTRTDQRIATLALDSTVGNSAFDSASGHVFVSAQSANQLVEIDPARHAIVARYDLPGADSPHGLLIDAADRLALIACESNHRMLVFNLNSHRVTASFPVGPEPDVLAFDPQLHTLYVAGEQGVVSVFSVTATGVIKTGEGFLADNAHVVVIDPATHLVYFPLRNIGGTPMLRIMRPLTVTAALPAHRH